MGEQKEKAERAARMKRLRIARAKEMGFLLLMLTLGRALLDFAKWLGEPYAIGLSLIAGCALLWYIWNAEE